MKVYKEEAVTASQQFAVKILINNVNRPDLMVGEHWHDYYEVLYIMDGTARQTIENRAATVGAGDIVLIQPGEVHQTQALSEAGCGIIVLLFFPCCLNFDNVQNVYSRYLNLFRSDLKNISGFLHSPYPYGEEIMRMMSRLNEEYTLRPAGYELVAKGLIYQFLGYLQRIGGLSIGSDACRSRDLRVVEICRYIEEHYAAPLRLEELAAQAGYTKEYFSKLFKDVVGENFKTFVDYVRVSEAERLLSREEASVGEAAFRTGYSSLYTFSRAFKRVKGYPPSEAGKADKMKTKS